MASRSDSAEFDPGPALQALVDAEVDFVLIGGLAALAHGSAYPTFDVDVAYARDKRNLERLASALAELGATLRGASPDVPFLLDAETLEAGLNFTFDTRAGPLDVLGDPRALRATASSSERRRWRRSLVSQYGSHRWITSLP